MSRDACEIDLARAGWKGEVEDDQRGFEKNKNDPSLWFKG
jgi:hypothetical protein